MKRVAMPDLIAFGVKFLAGRGVPQANARYLSEIIVETEAFRQSTHGLIQFQALGRQLNAGTKPDAEPTIIRDLGCIALLEGKHCFGNLALKLAREMGADKAARFGIGFVAVRDTQWIGALGMSLIPIARAGYLTQAWAQSSRCYDCAPYGGIDARFSTNPIALAFPAEPDPVVADFSTTTISMSKGMEMKRKGEKTATPRFLDRDGNPTTDSTVLDHDGTLMFMGGDLEGYKGYALSMFNEALTALAGGSANNPESPFHQSFSLLIINPDFFGGRSYFQSEMKRFLGHVKSSRPRPGFEVRLPGERGFAALRDCRENGIPLDDPKINLLRKIAEENHLESVV